MAGCCSARPTASTEAIRSSSPSGASCATAPRAPITQIHGLEVASDQGEGTGGEVDGTAGYKDRRPGANGILLPVPEPIAGPLLAALRDLAQDTIFG